MNIPDEPLPFIVASLLPKREMANVVNADT